MGYYHKESVEVLTKKTSIKMNRKDRDKKYHVTCEWKNATKLAGSSELEQ